MATALIWQVHESRVAELRVLLDARGRHGLGDHNTTSLKAPPDHHLRRRQAALSRDVEQAQEDEQELKKEVRSVAKKKRAVSYTHLTLPTNREV
mgnify:CR=1 FL=1